jgi:hypothetical protein
MHEKRPKTCDGSSPSGATPRVGPLRSIADVQRELARVYRAARVGHLQMDQAKALTYILQVLANIVRDGALEARVAAVEEQLHAESTDQ